MVTGLAVTDATVSYLDDDGTRALAVRQLSVERTARIRGDVEYETIAIENGASIDGRLRHASAAAPSAAAEEPIRLISAVEASGAAA